MRARVESFGVFGLLLFSPPNQLVLDHASIDRSEIDLRYRIWINHPSYGSVSFRLFRQPSPRLGNEERPESSHQCRVLTEIGRRDVFARIGEKGTESAVDKRAERLAVHWIVLNQRIDARSQTPQR